MKTLFLSLITFLFSYASVQADEFEDWDTDGDGIIERHEFTSKFIDEYYDAWGAADERGIIEEGFFKESYAGLDTDNDNLLSDEEWMIGYNYFFEDYEIYEDIAVLDVDDSGNIEYEEFYNVVYDTSYFTDVDLDRDNYISEYELANFVFENWDLNGTGMISRSEFEKFEQYYLDV